MSATKKNQIRREMDRLARELSRLESLPDGDAMPNGTVLAVALRFTGGGRSYQYVGLKVADLWYFTGRGPHRASWDEVAEWLARPQVRIIAIESIAELALVRSPAVDLGDMIQGLSGGRVRVVPMGDLGLGGDYR